MAEQRMIISEAPAQTETRPIRMAVFLFLGLTTLFRLYFVQTFPLTSDEAYYWQWSRHLAWGYYDQGPVIAWVTRLGTWLFGNTELGVRVTAIVLGLGINLLIYDFCRRFLNEALGLILVIFMNGTLLFSIGSIIQTYDTPQSFFWMLTVYCTATALFGGRPRAWYVAGLAAGLAMLTKYSAVLLPGLVFLYLLIHPDMRHWLRRKEPWLSAVIAFLVYSPNLAWNAAHQWISFNHTMSHAGGIFQITTLEFLGGQTVLIGPIAFAMLIIGLVTAWKKASRGDAVQAFLLWTSVPVLLFFLVLSFRTSVYGNWTGPAYLTAVLAAGAALYPSLRTSIRWRRWGIAALATGYLVVVLMFAHAPIIRALNVPGHLDPTKEVYGWPEMGRAIGEVLAAWPEEERPFIFGLRYQIAGLAAFYTPGQPETHCLFLPDDRLNQYVLWTHPDRLEGKNGLAVVYEPLNPRLNDLFEQVDLIQRVPVTGLSGQVIHYLALYRCINFKGYDFRPLKGLPHG
jgi:4-amino-4-deoxy-L-arabinose transferase-like glycosyltransferase